MHIRTLSAALALGAAPLLLSSCGSSGSVEEFCAVFQQVDEADDEKEGLPLLEDLEDVAPSDRLADAVKTVRETVQKTTEDGLELTDLSSDEQAEAQAAYEFLDAYTGQNCAT